MTLNKQELTFTLTIKEVSVWMVAVAASARSGKGTIFPWDSCPFFKQHEELVRLTGHCAEEHQRLRSELEATA